MTPFPGPVKTGQEKYVPNLISVSVPVRKKLTKDTFNIERFYAPNFQKDYTRNL